MRDVFFGGRCVVCFLVVRCPLCNALTITRRSSQVTIGAKRYRGVVFDHPTLEVRSCAVFACLSSGGCRVYSGQPVQKWRARAPDVGGGAAGRRVEPSPRVTRDSVRRPPRHAPSPPPLRTRSATRHDGAINALSKNNGRDWIKSNRAPATTTRAARARAGGGVARRRDETTQVVFAIPNHHPTSAGRRGRRRRRARWRCCCWR